MPDVLIRKRPGRTALVRLGCRPRRGRMGQPHRTWSGPHLQRDTAGGRLLSPHGPREGAHTAESSAAGHAERNYLCAPDADDWLAHNVWSMGVAGSQEVCPACPYVNDRRVRAGAVSIGESGF